MSNWPITAATRYETQGVSSGIGVTVTSGASANQKGSYALIGSTTGFAYDGFILQVTGVSTIRGRLDIASNIAADEIIVQDLFFDNASGIANEGFKIPIPVAVPSGAQLKARLQANVGSATCRVSIIGYTGSAELPKGYRALLSATDFTNTDPANSVTPSGTTLSAWGTVAASSQARFAGLYFSAATGGTTSGRTATALTYNIGIGASGSEIILISSIASQFTTNGPSGAEVGPRGPFKCDIPSGKRLAFQFQNNVTSNVATSCALSGLVA